MSGRPQNVFIEKLFFTIYHAIIGVGSLFLLNYLSLPRPDVSSALERMINGRTQQEERTQQKLSDRPVLRDLSGDVRVFEDEFSGSERAAVDQDVLRTGYTIETKEDATVVLDLKGSGKIRLMPLTVVKIAELDKQNDDKIMTLLTLAKGALISTTKLGAEKVIDVKAGLSRYSLQSSTAAIVSDGESYNFMAVNAGSVRAENSLTLKFDMIPARHSYFVNKEKQERKSDKIEAIKLFDWKNEALATEMTADEIIAATGGPFKVTEEQKLDEAGITAQMIAELEAKVAEEMKRFKAESTEIQRELASEQEALTTLLKSQEKEAIKVYADINCLETSKQCDLYSEKLLLARGYGRIHKSSRMAESIIKDLKKYLDEQTAIKVEKQKVVDELAKLDSRRKESLVWIESRMADKTQLKEILNRLADPTLSR